MYFHILSMIASKWVLCKRFFTIFRRFEEYQRVTNIRAMAASEEEEKAANSSKSVRIDKIASRKKFMNLALHRKSESELHKCDHITSISH